MKKILILSVLTISSLLILTGCKGALSDERLAELYAPRTEDLVVEDFVAPTEASEIEEVEAEEDVENRDIPEEMPAILEAAPVQDEPSLIYIGDEDASLNIEFTNLTNTVISNIQLRANGQWDFDAGLMDDEYILCRQTAVLAFTPSTEDSLPYDLRLTMSDGKTYTLHDLDFTQWDNGSILITDGTCYTEYTSNVTNELVSTYDYEVSVAQSYVATSAPDSGCIGSTGLTY